jgi:hypothetical protein
MVLGLLKIGQKAVVPKFILRHGRLKTEAVYWQVVVNECKKYRPGNYIIG